MPLVPSTIPTPAAIASSHASLANAGAVKSTTTSPPASSASASVTPSDGAA